MRGHGSVPRTADFIDDGRSRREAERERAAWVAFRDAAARLWMDRLMTGNGRVELG